MSIDTLVSRDSEFPQKLRQLHNIPKKLHTVGDFRNLLKYPALGIVGSRKVSPYGRSVTIDLASTLSRQGAVIVSGLALGVDSIAHQAAIDCKGKTIAVLPSSIEKIYPASHTELARKIVTAGGALVTEYEGKLAPMRHQFIERNRIIAALSDALLITEAAENSGSLHTARFALELGKPVLAVPGNITSATSAGTNNLIKMGATPVTSVQDIFDNLNIEQRSLTAVEEIYGDNEHETMILRLLKDGVHSGAMILEASKLKADSFQQHLTMLEIKGRIKPLGNDTWGLA